MKTLALDVVPPHSPRQEDDGPAWSAVDCS